jgi:hypothetical protein
VALLACGSAVAQDVGAAASGNWATSATWLGGIIPGQSNNVYIGSTNPSGAVSTATVTVSVSDMLANNLYLGYGNGTNGTLVLDGYKVLVFNTLAIGKTGGTGTISESNGGSFQTANLEIHNGNALTFNASDVAKSVLVDTGSTLELGASASFSGIVDVRNTGSVLNLNGNNLSAQYVYLGYNGGQAVTLDRGAGGTITADQVQVSSDDSPP